MKPYEVATFKKFLQINGMDSLFINHYRTRRWEHNPQSIEEYMFRADTEDVCMKAFYFVQNSTYGFEFWDNMQERFCKYVKDAYNQEHADNWRKMHGRKRAMLLRTGIVSSGGSTKADLWLLQECLS